MALFGDEDDDVGPFVMAEGGEEWFPFTLDNLEMDRACSSAQDDARPMDQDGDGETDQDDDIDGGNPSAEASGPGPPDSGRFQPQRFGGAAGGDSGLKLQGQHQDRGGSGGVAVPEPKARLERVKPEAKEVGSSPKICDARLSRKRERRREKDRTGQIVAFPPPFLSFAACFLHECASKSASTTNASRRTWSILRGTNGGAKSTLGRTSKSSSSSAAHGGGGNGMGGGSMTKPPAVQNKRRLERNAREQKRSLKISQRIEDLRRMLSQFGVDVKASKSAVLSEATDYIAHLQRQHAQSEAERARILQLLHNANSGSSLTTPAVAAAAAAVGGSGVLALPGAAAGVVATSVAGATAATVQTVKPPPTGTALCSQGVGAGGTTPAALTDRQQGQQTVPGFPGLSAAARSGVVDGSVPVHPLGRTPLAMGSVLGGAMAGAGDVGAASLGATARALSHVNYERVFRTVPLPMAIANVNGNLVDCNTRLSQITGFRREEALFMTIFDLVADPFLQHTFSMISSILSMRGVTNPPFFQVPGKHSNGRPGGVVQISAVLDEQLRPTHFCICILDAPTGGSGGGCAAPAAVAAVSPAGLVGCGGNGTGGSASGGLNPDAIQGAGNNNNNIVPGTVGVARGSDGGSVVRIRGNVG
ncbi:unnamed protein product [Scytosiphon promiscuus]